MYVPSLFGVVQRLAGPMFLKELRIASRRRRHYLVRCAYTALLLFVTVQAWYLIVRVGSAGSAVVQTARFAEAGKHIVATILGVQFVAAQVLVTVLSSDAISGEIRRRTLEALLVTPVGSLHIVVGKLLSTLVQLVLVLAISLPLLAVVRVFGGVPWDYVVSGFCITLTAAVFTGSLSLFSSVRHRHAYEAVVLVGLWYFVIWGLAGGTLTALAQVGYINRRMGLSVLFLTNPPAAMLIRTKAMVGASGGANSWLLHCLVILGAATILLALCAWRVRRITLAALLARAGGSPPRKLDQSPAKTSSIWPDLRVGGAIRSVKGAPMVWKELCRPLFRTNREILFHLGLWVVVAGLVGGTLLLFRGAMYASFFIPILTLQWVLILRLGVMAAGSITREKEARTWPILLTTPLENREIITGKAVAALRRCLPLLISLLVLYALAVLLGPTYGLGPLLSVLAAVVGLCGTVVFLLGVGLYLSTRLKTTTMAVVSTLGLYFVPKLFCCGGSGPVVLLFLSPGGSGVPGRGGLAGILAVAVVPPVLYAAVGLLCLRAAVRRVRRGVF